MNTSYEKYFVIGFNKTATCTFHNLFIKNNLTSQHIHTKWDTDKYQCFSDNGENFPNNYRELDLKYKNSIFILNVRQLDNWLISRFKNGLRKKNNSHWLYPFTNEDQPNYKRCEEWIYKREKYHLEILDYFSKRPNKIIIVNIDRQGWINYVCSKLHFNPVSPKNIHVTDVDNKNHIKIIKLVNETLEKLKYDKKTILFPNKDKLNKYIKIYNNYI